MIARPLGILLSELFKTVEKRAEGEEAEGQLEF